jgi:galactose mutarotase-like enzyme
MADPTSIISTEKENVVIQAGACAVTILPHFGGKIASILVDRQELLQTPLAPIAARTRTMPFDAGDASGWDECLPSVAPCIVPVEGGSAHVPDHGDLWRVSWQEIGGNGSSIHLRAACFSLPLELERALTLRKTGKGYHLSAAYKLTNTGRKSAPWSWAAHPLFVVKAGDRILLPPTIQSLHIEGSGGNRLGETGETVTWPVATMPAGGTCDLSVAQPADSGIGDKLFAGPLAASENWCALERPSANVRIRTTFDTAENPYLGLWICYGGWPEGPGPKQTCVALEPATAPVDSLAKTGPWSRNLKPGRFVQWGMNFDLESL